MADNRDPEIDRKKVVHTAEHDFEGGLKENGSAVGGADTSSAETISGTWTWADDVYQVFGDDDDFKVRFDATAGKYVIEDGTNELLRIDATSGDVEVNHADLTDGSNVIYDQSSTHVPLTILEASSVTVAGNSVSLGGSTSIAHADISSIGASDHHAKYTDEEAQDAVGNNVGDGLSYDDANATVEMNVVATGNVSLSSGAATVDTGISESTTATFQVAIGPTTDDAEITASIQANSGGNYTVHFDEINTSVGNPTVEYDVIRVR